MHESKIRHELVLAALDWAFIARDPQQSKLLNIAEAAAADIPQWERPLIRVLQQNEAEPLEKLAAALLKSRGSPTALALAGLGLVKRGKMKEAIQVLGKAQQVYPGDFWLNRHLGRYLDENAPQKSLPFSMAAVALAADSPGAHCSLGHILYRIGELDDAIAEFRHCAGTETRFCQGAYQSGRRPRQKRPAGRCRCRDSQGGWN